MRKAPLILLVLLQACSNDGRLIRKKIESDSVTVVWYYYSNIGGNSKEVVAAKKGDDEVKLFSAVSGITDVAFNGKEISIKVFKNSGGLQYTDSALPMVFNHPIHLDSSATLEEFQNRPKGEKQK